MQDASSSLLLIAVLAALAATGRVPEVARDVARLARVRGEDDAVGCPERALVLLAVLDGDAERASRRNRRRERDRDPGGKCHALPHSSPLNALWPLRPRCNREFALEFSAPPAPARPERAIRRCGPPCGRSPPLSADGRSSGSRGGCPSRGSRRRQR